MRRRNEARWAYWRQVLDDHWSSGLSIAEFCRQRQLNQASFYDWRKKLASIETEKTSVAVDSGNVVSTSRSTAGPVSSSLFVSLPVADTESRSSPASRASFELELPNGIRVRVPAPFDVSELTSLLQTVTRFEIDHA